MPADAELRIGGNVDELIAASAKAVGIIKDMSTQVQAPLKSINDHFKTITTTFAAFTAALAGGAAFKNVINSAADWNSQAAGLAKSLGTTTEKASVMNVALNHFGISSEVVISGSQKMARQIHTNGEAFQKLGVDVRDANGQYRPAADLMGEVNQKLAEIKNPIEQAVAGQQVYGKGWSEMRPLLKLTAEAMSEAEERAKQLHLIVGPEGDALAKQYKMQLRDLNLVGKSLEVQFGNALMPVFVKMGAWMGQEAPAMGNVFRNVLYGIAAAAQTLWEIIKGLGQAIAAFGAAAHAALSGNFSGAGAIFNAYTSDAAATGSKIKAIWKDAFTPPAVKASKLPDFSGSPTYDFGKGGGGGRAKGAGSAPAAKSRVNQWETELAEAKVFYQKNNDLREFSKAQEIDYWRNILSTANASGEERLAITKKIAVLELEELKKKAQQVRALESEAINAREKEAEDALRIDQLASEQAYELGNLSKQEMLQLDQQYEDRRFAIQQNAQSERIAALKTDPNMDPVALQKLLDQMAEIQRRHAYSVARLNKEAAIESKNQWDSIVNPMSGAFQSALAGMLQGTMTWRQALGNIFKSVLDLFTSMISKMLMKWISNELAKTASSQAGTTARMGLDTVAAATSVTTKATEATAVVGANAAEAASGAASSQASIPYVGPILAAAAFASILAMVLGARSSISSARGGYDIPAGINPMTQLHEREMVLPAAQADVIRRMADDRVSGGGGNHYHVHAVDARGVERLLRDNGHVLTSVLREQARNFNR